MKCHICEEREGAIECPIPDCSEPTCAECVAEIAEQISRTADS